MNPTIILVHHGFTAFDEAPGRVQSWTMLELDERGVEVASKTAKALEKYPIWHVIASKIQRTSETGKIIADHLGKLFIPTELLTPWNKKPFVGQLDKDVAKICKWFCDNPDVKIPGGESYRTYYERWKRGWDWLTSYAEANPEKAICGVTHSENFASLAGVDSDTLGVYDTSLVPPCGEYMVLQKINSKWGITEQSW